MLQQYHYLLIKHLSCREVSIITNKLISLIWHSFFQIWWVKLVWFLRFNELIPDKTILDYYCVHIESVLIILNTALIKQVKRIFLCDIRLYLQFTPSFLPINTLRKRFVFESSHFQSSILLSENGPSKYLIPWNFIFSPAKWVPICLFQFCFISSFVFNSLHAI